MLNVLKKRLPEGLSIASVKELHSDYLLLLQFEGESASVHLPKSCTPGCHNKVVDTTIKTAMATIYFNRGDYVKAKEWLDKQ